MISLSLTESIVLAVSALTFATLLRSALRSIRAFCSTTGDLGRAYQKHFPKCSGVETDPQPVNSIDSGRESSNNGA